MTTLEAWDKERKRHTHGVEDTADLIVGLHANAIVEAYRAGKEAGDAERDRLREALDRIINYPDKPDCYTPEEMQDIARTALAEGGQDE
jgi:hypothetical protein